MKDNGTTWCAWLVWLASRRRNGLWVVGVVWHKPSMVEREEVCVTDHSTITPSKQPITLPSREEREEVCVTDHSTITPPSRHQNNQSHYTHATHNTQSPCLAHAIPRQKTVRWLARPHLKQDVVCTSKHGRCLLRKCPRARKSSSATLCE